MWDPTKGFPGERPPSAVVGSVAPLPPLLPGAALVANGLANPGLSMLSDLMDDKHCVSRWHPDATPRSLRAPKVHHRALRQTPELNGGSGLRLITFNISSFGNIS